jgi:hypothetical protein
MLSPNEVDDLLARARDRNLLYSFTTHCYACEGRSREEDVANTLFYLEMNLPELFYEQRPANKRRRR